MEGEEMKMNVELINANDVFKDNNNGLIYGIQEIDRNGYYGDYTEWFETEGLRAKVIAENNMIIGCDEE